MPLLDEKVHTQHCNDPQVINELRMVRESLAAEGKLTDQQLYNKLETIYQQITVCHSDILFSCDPSENETRIHIRKINLLLALVREMDHLSQSHRAQSVPAAENEETKTPGEHKESTQVIEDLLRSAHEIEGFTLLDHRRQVLGATRHALEQGEKFYERRCNSVLSLLICLPISGILAWVLYMISPAIEETEADGTLGENGALILALIVAAIAAGSTLGGIGVGVSSQCKISSLLRQTRLSLLGLIPELSDDELIEGTFRQPEYRKILDKNLYKDLADKLDKIMNPENEEPIKDPKDVCCTVCLLNRDEEKEQAKKEGRREKGGVGMVRVAPDGRFDGPYHRECSLDKVAVRATSPLTNKHYFKDRNSQYVFWELDRAMATLTLQGLYPLPKPQAVAPRVESPPVRQADEKQAAGTASLTLGSGEVAIEMQQPSPEEMAQTRRALADHQRRIAAVVAHMDAAQRRDESASVREQKKAEKEAEKGADTETAQVDQDQVTRIICDM